MRVIASVCSVLVATTAFGATPLTTTRVASGLTQPLYMTGAPGDPAGRLFVVQRGGLIRIVEPNGTIRTTPFLNVSALISTTWLEYGLLGLVFDPNYATNGYFYVNYTPPNGTIADTQIVRYRRSVADANVADVSTASTILRFNFGTRREHRAGWMGFGPDGYMYVSTGDGGESDPDNAAQNLTLLRGKILRIDVNGPDGLPDTGDEDGFPADANKNYRIPATNPYAGSATNAQEIWASGLRNPWRCSFDRMTGDFWIGDVGQSTREEINFQAANAANAAGRNYGWRCTEGTFCPGLSGCTCNGPALIAPFTEYTHSVGLSVTCGYVYRGCAIPDFRGTFFYADYQLSKMFSLRNVGGVATNLVDRTAELAPTGFTLQTIASLGEDTAGEIYVCDYNGGEIFKIVPRTVAETGITMTLQPSPVAGCYGGQAVFTAGATSPDVETGTMSYRWYRGDVTAMVDGPSGSGSVVSGAMTNQLTITGIHGGDSGLYRCRVSTPCRVVESNTALLSLCVADFNCDATGDFFDYLDFVDEFASLSANADFNGDGTVDFFDYLDFVDAFSGGC